MIVWPLLIASLSAAVAQVPSGASSRPWLEDVTEAWGLRFEHDSGAAGDFYFAEIMGAGAALLDFDGDGDLDAYLVQGGRLDAGASRPSDRLFRNDLQRDTEGEPVPRFVDVTERSGIVADEHGMGIAVGDLDGDGWLDLYLPNFGANQLWRNRGDGTFVETTAASGLEERRWSVVAVPFDFDADGHLDLFVGNYTDFSVATSRPCFGFAGTQDYCSPRSHDPLTNRLFHNRGGGVFEDVSLPSGLGREPGNTLGGIAGYFDGDGLLDLYEANDLEPNRLWLNQGDGTFVDEGLIRGAAVGAMGEPEASMGVVASDLDGDLDPDLFLTHLENQKNTLYLNEGELFVDASVERGLGPPSWPFTAFGIAVVDVDLDGWRDLLVVNGAVTTLPELRAGGDPFPFHQRGQLFRNLGGGWFQEVPPAEVPELDRRHVGRGVATGDVDLDGRTDVLISNNGGPARLLSSRAGGGRSWVAARVVDGRGGDRLGALVTVRTGAGRAAREQVRTDGSYASASAPWIELGLGDGPGPLELEVTTPAGERRRVRGLGAERIYHFVFVSARR
jgi:enediyne biosynthesis protein E4